MTLIASEREIVDQAVELSLRDGSRVLLRRLTPDDATAVLNLHESLDSAERYLRFFTAHPQCMARLTAKLTDDGDDVYALGAFEAGTLIGVASYTACREPATADVAIVVAHDNHLRGVGTIMLRRLTQVARDRGIQRLVADVLATNHTMFKVLYDGGLRPRELGALDGVVHLQVDLPELASISDES